MHPHLFEKTQTSRLLTKNDQQIRKHARCTVQVSAMM